MRLTPKIFICELADKVRKDGDCCWLQGYITGVYFNEKKEVKCATIDDGTQSVKVYVESYIREMDEADNNYENELDVKKTSTKIYNELLGQLLCKGRYISTICELRNGILYIIHISDSINDDPNSEVEWLNSIIKSRQGIIF
ncbi:hypothetical protein FG379_000955 [Cryptosporidium bovis]|uniref:uncharacterized protein n=1 Tax=Cryptosporidium bovis TaxID=310047 RepID=UPI00351A53C0|nr:hypothetical protein FG379_000955 [Cryptosporidium bovis]